MSADRLRIPHWWQDVLRSAFDVDVASKPMLRSIASSLEQLSKHLNDVRGREEQHTKPYLADPALLRAYVSYYATANMLKLHVPLREIARSGAFDDRGSISVVDLGCGPGTGIAGCVSWFAAMKPEIELRYIGIDVVPAALHAAARIGAAAAPHLPGLTVETRRSDITRLRESLPAADIVLMMNALNELPQTTPALLRHLESMVSEDGWLVLIEPALRGTSRRLLEFRDFAVREGWSVYAPCFRQSNCPALEREQDWCHHDAPWERPAFMAELDAMLGFVKLSLKFSYIVLNRRGSTLGGALDLPDPCRVVSELAIEKGRSWCFVCGEQGRIRCRRNNRDATAANGAFDEISRYDIVSIENAEASGSELCITPETHVRLSDI